ncbi:MAG TPA: pseudouridine synthase [Terracidiphilus sp.]|nr:pseudouridine synthase [Terracidiphilus sp.]
MAIKKAAKTVKKSAKKSPKKAAKAGDQKPEALEALSSTAPEIEVPATTPTAGIVDPIGDTTDGEGGVFLTDETTAQDVSEEGADAEIDEAEDGEDAESEFIPKPRPPAKLDRLQKILSQAGVASRRKAEEMIEQGRVQVNGTVVTELGTKADANRDHIRVDGKLLHGAERLRYFVLNKPKGFVTTVKDPEGRPTVMQFFEKMRERLYPVGRLDYMSEGLLLVTNDGDLANKLTKAGSGVEKVYLVKVAGQPTESELELLRGGVSIERGKPGSPQVRTSPARIRQVRQGDNPWYEVVLIEGRNRELRKMFVAIGHFVEKIRRVGYGPLVLDQEPGNMRELDAQELAALRLASEGKLRTPKAKEVRRRNLADSQLPTVKPKPTGLRPGGRFEARKPTKPFAAQSIDKPRATAAGSGEFRPKRAFGASKPGTDTPFRTSRPAGEGFRPAAGRNAAEPGKFGERKFGPSGSGPARPAWKKDDRPSRPPARFAADPNAEARPAARKPFTDRPSTGRTYGAKPAGARTFGNKPAGTPFAARPSAGRPAADKPAWKRPGADRPAFKRPSAPRRVAPADTEGFTPIKPGGLRIDPVEPGSLEARRPAARSQAPARSGGGRPAFDRPRTGNPGFSKPSFRKPGFEKPGFDKPEFKRFGPAKPRFEKPGFEKSGFAKPRFEKPGFDRASGGRSSSSPSRGSAEGFSGARAPRGESGMARPFTTSSGKPRVGGARPSSKPFKPSGHSSSKPRPGGFSKSGPKGAAHKGKPGGLKRTGPRPGGKRRG